MCYFLYIASPLTLSEVRSMLPAGLTADLAPTEVRAAFQKLHPPTKTVARLLVGGCSCDLVQPRLEDTIDDERELRARYRQAKLSRAEVIRELEGHRRGPSRSEPAGGWASTLSGFVVEHARNAGPTLYLLEFGLAGSAPAPGRPEDIVIRLAREVGGSVPWLVEGKPIRVT